MTVVDCIMASYETDALLVRDAELAGVVDLRVIVQGTETFRGRRLPSLHRFVTGTPWRTPTVIEFLDFGPVREPWEREAMLRQFSLDTAAGDPDLWLLLADADEIPHPVAVRNAVWHGEQAGAPSLLPVDQREWFMDWRIPDAWQPPHQPLLGRYRHYEDAGGAQAARAAFNWSRTTPRGWHLSTLGDAALASVKLSAFSHSEYDTDRHNTIGILTERRRTRRDIVDRFDLEPTRDLPGCAYRFPHLLSPDAS